MSAKSRSNPAGRKNSWNVAGSTVRASRGRVRDYCSARPLLTRPRSISSSVFVVVVPVAGVAVAVVQEVHMVVVLDGPVFSAVVLVVVVGDIVLSDGVLGFGGCVRVGHRLPLVGVSTVGRAPVYSPLSGPYLWTHSVGL